MSEVAETVIEMIAEQLGISTNEVKTTHHLVEELQFDDLHTVELIMSLEEEFEIDIEDEKFGLITTVQGVINFITDFINDLDS